jgi:hypothetical protein
VFKFLKILTSRLLVKVKMKNKTISGSGLMKLKHINGTYRLEHNEKAEVKKTPLFQFRFIR